MNPFVPPPLPPNLGYDSGIATTLARANLRLGQLAGLASRLPNPNLLIQPFMRQEAVLSSRIEGTEADVADLYRYEAGKHTPGKHGPRKHGPAESREPRTADVEEIRNYVRAMEYGLGRLDTLPISLRLIQELHQLLMEGVRGQNRDPGNFRRVPNWIGAPGSSMAEATYVPPPASELTAVLGALESYLHAADAEDPPLIRLAFVHYQFEAIHPFLDGNGRIGRLLISLLLVHWDLLPLPLLYLSAYFERYRDRYYELLLNVSLHGEWKEWTRFFLDGVAIQSSAAAQLVIALQDLQSKWQAQLTKPGASTLLPELAKGLLDRPILSIPQAAARLMTTYPTAKKHVDRLVEEGILTPIEGTSNPKLFAARAVLELLKT